MEISIEVPQKIKNRTTTEVSNSISYISKENENTNLKSYMQLSVQQYYLQ